MQGLTKDNVQKAYQKLKEIEARYLKQKVFYLGFITQAL